MIYKQGDNEFKTGKFHGFISAGVLVFAVSVALACRDNSVPDILDTGAEVYSLPCGTTCNGTPGTCGGTQREQISNCTYVAPPDPPTNKNCSMGSKEVTQHWFSGTCSMVNDACVCLSKQDWLTTQVRINTCTCVTHFCDTSN